MKSTIIQFSKILSLALGTILFISLQANAQGSPDALLSSNTTSGETHATVKVRSNGFSNNTSEIKLTNMNSGGAGTEFVLRSTNEAGLVVSSNSDLSENTTDNIMTFKPNGDLNIGAFAGGGTQIVSTDNTGKLLESQSNFGIKTNLNTAPVNITSSVWTAVGPSYTFTKEFDHTIIDAQYLGILNYATTSASGVRVRIQIGTTAPSPYAEGAVNSNSANSFVVSKNIFKTLPSGTYTAQVYGRSLGGNATNVQLGPSGLGGTIWIEERL